MMLGKVRVKDLEPRLTHVHMVSMSEDRNDGYTISSPAYIVEVESTTQSPSPSTTPEEPTCTLALCITLIANLLCTLLHLIGYFLIYLFPVSSFKC